MYHISAPGVSHSIVTEGNIGTAAPLGGLKTGVATCATRLNVTVSLSKWLLLNAFTVTVMLCDTRMGAESIGLNWVGSLPSVV